MREQLRDYLGKRETEAGQIPDGRRAVLGELSAYTAARHRAGSDALLVFICTHNSRRSHMAQAAALAAAEFHGVGRVRCFSGGTEATAFFPLAIAALAEAGFLMEKLPPTKGPAHPHSGTADGPDNPRYLCRTADGAEGTLFYSKRFDDPANPQADFAAVMTCTDADAACPIVPGAAVRIRLPFDDPKAFDATPQAAVKYRERLADITREILFAMRAVRDGLADA